MTLAHQNPFRSEQIDSCRYLSESGDIDDTLIRALCCAKRGAIVGPPGTGKSTLMRSICERLKSQGEHVRFLRVTSAGGRFDPAWKIFLDDPPTANDTVLLDGGGELPWFARIRLKRVCKNAHRCLMTGHHDFWLPTLVRPRITAQLLHTVVSTLSNDPIHCSLAQQMYQGSQTDVRFILRALYDFEAMR